ncbi:MAG: hypothetical protein NPIRA04_27010 [Nitrospirales bacterium]|nr:MAG: hypothetical protein NPIRA04_27010 [Nitrospirales bacterium]
MRYDNFIIWGNGIDHVPEIVNMIRSDGNFSIVLMKTFHINNMEEFIKTIYGCDPYPWEHLIAKTQYLLKSLPEIVFVLVKNKNPNEIIKDNGVFEHVECMNVVNLKIKVRNAFNPKFDEPSRQVLPLDVGVSHEHCIHGSDNEKQTDYVLKALELESLNYYKRYENLECYFPYHIEFNNYEKVDVNVDGLQANIIGRGIIPLQKTPHFKYLIGQPDDYIQYFYSNFGTNLCEDHFPEAFENLIKNFDIHYTREDKKQSHIIIDAKNVILDGVHRAVIYKSKNINKVKCIQIDTHEWGEKQEQAEVKTYSYLIDLQEYFKHCPHEYCLIKMNEHFPNYYNYSDLDILCTDIHAMVTYTKEFSKKYDKKNIKFLVNRVEDGHIQVDVYPKGKSLNLKFDLFDNLNIYKKFVVDDVFMQEIIKSRILKRDVFVPNIVYDLALRYMEYVEYKNDRSDKIKHYNYVNQHPELIDEMLNVIKQYTNILRRENLLPLDSGGFYPLAKTCQLPKLSLIYEQYFGRRNNGTFVEVGAFDGEYVSNTSGLSDSNWSGLYLEPVPEFYKKCRDRHSRNKLVKVVNTAVGDQDGEITMHVGGPLSTASRSMQENFKRLKWAKNCFQNDTLCTVSITTLTKLLNEHKINPGFEVLVIDVEGYEWEVLKGFDITYWKPQMVLIELHDQNDDYHDIRSVCNNIVEYFEKAKYKVIWKDFTNTIYVPRNQYPLPLEHR